MRPQEKKLYKPVFHFIKNHFKCFNSEEKAINKGPLIAGRADIVGVRDIGGWVSGDIEVIVVEVKRNISSFGRKLGEAFGYSVFAHRCYLAVFLEKNEKLTNLHKDMAAKIGVGLIGIRKKYRTYQCEEITTAPRNEPNVYFLNLLLWEIGLVKCCICRCYHENNATRKLKSSLRMNKSFRYEKNYNEPYGEKGIIWDFKGKWSKGFWICHTCLSKVILANNKG